MTCFECGSGDDAGFLLLLWTKPGDEFLDISREKPKAPDLLQNPHTLTTTTTTAIGHEHETDWMVTEVTMTIRYVEALWNEHISTVQGFGYIMPRIQR